MIHSHPRADSTIFRQDGGQHAGQGVLAFGPQVRRPANAKAQSAFEMLVFGQTPRFVNSSEDLEQLRMSHLRQVGSINNENGIRQYMPLATTQGICEVGILVFTMCYSNRTRGLLYLIFARLCSEKYNVK